MNNAYGFRIIGGCDERRRLVDPVAALAAHCACDERAQVHLEAYLSAFWFDQRFQEYLDENHTPKGYRGSCWSPWLWFDIDRDDDLELARRDTARLVLSLVERYSLDDDRLLIFFSGRKGFCCGLPAALWSPESSDDFHRYCRALAELLAAQAQVRIDTSIYAKVQPLRAPNSRHPKTGRHKRRLLADQLINFSIDYIVELARQPLPFELPDPPSIDDQAVKDWHAALAQVQQADAAHRARRGGVGVGAQLNRQTLDFIKNGADCGDRHRLLFSAAANLAEFDCPPELAHALLTDAALDSGLPPSETKRQIDCGLARRGGIE